MKAQRYEIYYFLKWYWWTNSVKLLPGSQIVQAESDHTPFHDPAMDDNRQGRSTQMCRAQRARENKGQNNSFQMHNKGLIKRSWTLSGRVSSQCLPWQHLTALPGHVFPTSPFFRMGSLIVAFLPPAPLLYTGFVLEQGGEGRRNSRQWTRTLAHWAPGCKEPQLDLIEMLDLELEVRTGWSFGLSPLK